MRRLLIAFFILVSVGVLSACVTNVGAEGQKQAIRHLACQSKTIEQPWQATSCAAVCAQGGGACTGVNSPIQNLDCDSPTKGPATCRCCGAE